jgi:hypothetical protein
MLLVLICVGLVLWALGSAGRAMLGVLIVVLVVWAAVQPPKPHRPWVEGTYADGTPLPPLWCGECRAVPMYDESGRPNSHGAVLTLPSVMPHHPVHARRRRASVAPSRAPKFDAEMAKAVAEDRKIREENPIPESKITADASPTWTVVAPATPPPPRPEAEQSQSEKDCRHALRADPARQEEFCSPAY